MYISPVGPLGFFREKAAASALKLRHAMLRCIAHGLLSALDFCHSRGVYHGSLGIGSVLINSLEDAEGPNILVKLDNFGFARWFPRRRTANAGARQCRFEKIEFRPVPLVHF